MESKQMKVLSLPQPWATLIVRGVKRICIQPFATTYRGAIQIHASKVMHCGMLADERRQYLARVAELVPDMPDFRDLEFGSIIGEVEVAHVLDDPDVKD